MYRYRLGTIIGVSLILAGMLFSSLVLLDKSVVAALINAGCALAIASSYLYKRTSKEPPQDERTRKIVYTALAASYQILLFSLAIAWWINYIHPINISLDVFIGGVIFLMIALSALTNSYYTRRGVKI